MNVRHPNMDFTQSDLSLRRIYKYTYKYLRFNTAYMWLTSRAGQTLGITVYRQSHNLALSFPAAASPLNVPASGPS